jgi:hypothetical protein
MQKFCHNCGKQVVVGAKFCNECGTNLTSLANSPTPPKKSGQFTPIAIGGTDEDEDYIDKIAHLDIRQNELQVEIIRDRPLGESVGALFTNAVQSAQAGHTFIGEEARPAAYQDGKQYLAEFSKEAGTSGPKNGRD